MHFSPSADWEFIRLVRKLADELGVKEEFLHECRFATDQSLWDVFREKMRMMQVAPVQGIPAQVEQQFRADMAAADEAMARNSSLQEAWDNLDILESWCVWFVDHHPDCLVRERWSIILMNFQRERTEVLRKLVDRGLKIEVRVEQ